jgi:hypothetical protein
MGSARGWILQNKSEKCDNWVEYSSILALLDHLIRSRQHVRRNSSFLKSTQVFNEAYAPNTTFASLPYSFSDFVDFSTVKENSFASHALFNLDTFNLGDDHNVRTFRALYVSFIWQCHSDLPWTANCGPGV